MSGISNITGAIIGTITTGQAGLGLLIVCCIAAIWAASGPAKQQRK